MTLRPLYCPARRVTLRRSERYEGFAHDVGGDDVEVVQYMSMWQPALGEQENATVVLPRGRDVHGPSAGDDVNCAHGCLRW